VNRMHVCRRLGSEFHVIGLATEKARRPCELSVVRRPNKLMTWRQNDDDVSRQSQRVRCTESVSVTAVFKRGRLEIF